MRNAASPPREIRGVHVLWALIAFFAAIIAINVAFSIVAIRTFPGEDVRRSYVQGLAYNDTLAARRAQAALGWRASAELARARGGAAQLDLRVVDRDGRAIAGLVFTGALRRPLAAQEDHPLQFEEIEAGHYRARLDAPAPGQWELRAAARRDDVRFELTRRVSWPPSD